MRKVVATYRNLKDDSKVRLYIREGVIVNPDVDEALMTGMANYTLSRLRKTGEETKRFDLKYEDEGEVVEVKEVAEVVNMDEVEEVVVEEAVAV